MGWYTTWLYDMDADALSDLLDATDNSSEELPPDVIAALNRSTSTCRGMAPLCVRVHRLTQAQAERIVSWAAAVGRVDVLADVTLERGHQAVTLLRTTLCEAGMLGRVRFLEFTSAQMEAEYPSLLNPSLLHYRTMHPWMLFSMSHAWAYTSEGITVTGLGRDADDEGRHCWIFEHDCDWAGDINELLMAYANDEADLIAKVLRPKERAARGGDGNPDNETLSEWMWYDCMTPAFGSRYGVSRGAAHVHAVRVSARLLDALHRSSRAGAIGYGEMTLPTVCVGEGMVWRPLKPDHIGSQYSPEGGVRREDFDLLKKARVNKLLHALKW